MKNVSLLAAGAACVAFAGASVAAPIASDSYEVGPGEYTESGLNGQAGSSAVGFSNPWAASSANLQADAGTLLNGAISYDDASTGKARLIPSTGFSTFFRRADRTLNPVTASPDNTYYMSHLVNAGGLVTNGVNTDYAFVGFGGFVAQQTIEGTANNLLGAFVGYTGNKNGGLDLTLRSRTGAAAGGIGDEVMIADAAENVTYHIVLKLEYNSPGDTVSYWVNPTSLGSDQGMTNTAAASGSVSGFQLAAPSDFQRLSAMTFGFDRSFFWDESRLGLTLEDVSGVAAIPAPSAAMGGLVLLGALARRRRA